MELGSCWEAHMPLDSLWLLLVLMLVLACLACLRLRRRSPVQPCVGYQLYPLPLWGRMTLVAGTGVAGSHCSRVERQREVGRRIAEHRGSWGAQQASRQSRAARRQQGAAHRLPPARLHQAQRLYEESSTQATGSWRACCEGMIAAQSQSACLWGQACAGTSASPAPRPAAATPPML